jgi:hypothetical protein
MATQPSRRAIRAGSPENQWVCFLSASPEPLRSGDALTLTTTLSHPSFDILGDGGKNEIYQNFRYEYRSDSKQIEEIIGDRRDRIISFTVPHIPQGHYRIDVTAIPLDDQAVILDILPQPVTGHTTIRVIPLASETKVTLQRTFAGPTHDRALWPAIRNRTAAIDFDRYEAFIDCVFCEENGKGKKAFSEAEQAIIATVHHCLHHGADQPDGRLSIYGPYAYGVLKMATQVFLTLESGVVIRDINQPGKPKIFDIEDERIRVNDFSLTLHKLREELKAYLYDTHGNLPYLNRILENLITIDPHRVHEVLPYCLGVLQHRLTSPSLIELIWSYWLEEGMLVQTMNAIARRFQNRRGSSYDPLGELEFDPLRPLNNVIWGFIQDEHNRLTVSRRAHEYIHHYGLSLVGKAVPDLNPADTRSKFIEAFHNLLSAAARFFREDSDTTVIADAFPLLNALKDVHLILAEGAHNQFGDLTWTARAEMMTIQWMLARPEMREFLRGRYMVPYQEEWMGAVDSMKKLQGWTDTTITHFYELAVTGERILLSIRYGDWSDIENIEDQAKNWARSCKPEIQRYIYAYQTVTGVDLSSDVVDSRDAATRYIQPSMHLQRRLAQQTSAMRLHAPVAPDLIAARTSTRVEVASAGQPRLPTYRKDS